jgi:hypothetical protein
LRFFWLAVTRRSNAQTVKKIWSVVTKTVQQLDAEFALRYSFAIQMERVETMRAIETKTPMLVVTGDGYKEITILKNIAGELVKLELKSSRPRDKNGGFLPRMLDNPTNLEKWPLMVPTV